MTRPRRSSARGSSAAAVCLERTDNRSYPPGALIATRCGNFWMASARLKFCSSRPSFRSANWSATRNAIVLDVLDNVQSRVWIMTPADNSWRRQGCTAVPKPPRARPVDRYESDQVFITYQDFLAADVVSRRCTTTGREAEIDAGVLRRVAHDGATARGKIATGHQRALFRRRLARSQECADDAVRLRRVWKTRSSRSTAAHSVARGYAAVC